MVLMVVLKINLSENNGFQHSWWLSNLSKLRKAWDK